MSTQDDRMTPNASDSAGHQDDKFSGKADHSQSLAPAEVPSNDLPDSDSASSGSLDLGKHRQKDAPVNTDPEKHVTQRAPSKEFHFPKSN